jgi:alginate O-acetyltransferase complex protein AlgI
VGCGPAVGIEASAIMHLCSAKFLAFFLAVFALYWALPWHRLRVWLLVVASFSFYAAWNRWLALLVLASATLDYLLARGISGMRNAECGMRNEAEGRKAERLGLLFFCYSSFRIPHSAFRRLLLLASLGSNLGLLFYFKYANFFLDSLHHLLSALDVSVHLGTLAVVVPIGISFYTFEAINYMVDVYRGRLRAERDLAHFLLFILFFPHLVAGPIVRAADFLPQVRRRKRWSWLRAHLGLRLILLGLVKKMALADQMALFADPAFADPHTFGAPALWLAAFAYAIQVYCDFSGYSDIALGTAHLLGYRLAVNFDMPYLAPNITAFWRRWHMSLSGWLRDYLFIPLGGSRGGTWRTHRNLLVTMMLCGLWHGAAWSYVVFGVLQALFLSGHSTFRGWCRSRPRLDRLLQTTAGTAVRVASTFTLFTCSLVVFRAPTLGSGALMLRRMAAGAAGAPPPRPVAVFALAALMMVLGHWLGWRDRWLAWYDRLPTPVRGLGYATALTAILLLTPVTTRTFIYFAF